jgi:hypothetical protein
MAKGIRYLQVMNSESGETVYIDVRRSRYDRLCRGFLNSLKLNSGFLKHIILTQDEEHYKPKLLNNFMNQLRRAYPGVRYLWTVEVQEERLEKYGVPVLHWHMMVAFPRGTRIDGTAVKRIQGFWKFGDPRNSCEIVPVKKPAMSYLLKYIGKALSSPVADQVRRIGSSRVPGYLCQSWARLVRAIGYFMSVGMKEEDMKEFQWSRNGNAFAEFYDDVGRKYRHKIYSAEKSPWCVVGRFVDDPF